MSEEWRAIPGHEGLYEVSSEGRVRSLDRVVPHSLHGTWKLSGRLLKPHAHASGYLAVSLYKEGVRTVHKIHYLVLEAFIGPRPGSLHGLHADDDSFNNAARNLRWGTRSENMRDAIKNGRNACVSRSHCRRGHPLVAPNLKPSGVRKSIRSCLACARAWNHLNATSDPEAFQALSDRYFEAIMSTSITSITNPTPAATAA